MGINIFAGDNDGDMVFDPSWARRLRDSYSITERVFHSPFDRRRPSSSETNAPLSYGMNGNVLDQNLSDALYPSDLILLAPKTSGEKNFTGRLNEDLEVDSECNGSGKTGGTHRSGQRIIVAYADGHTEDLSMSEFHNGSGGAEARSRRWELAPDEE